MDKFLVIAAVNTAKNKSKILSKDCVVPSWYAGLYQSKIASLGRITSERAPLDAAHLPDRTYYDMTFSH